jgi:hypothetical protein
MMFRHWWKILLILLFFLVRFATLSAQEAGDYVVTSSQSINARTCPRLTCDVARTFAPGDVLAVESLVEGDTVSGSDKWLQISEDESDIYVHSSLAEPIPAEIDEPEANVHETVSTSRWVEHNAHYALVVTPRNWMTREAMLEDEELIETLADWYDMEVNDLISEYEEEIAESTFDLALFEPFDGIWFYVWHEDLNGSEMSIEFLKRSILSDINGMGAEVVSDEILQLPAGEAIRFHLRLYEDDRSRLVTSEEIFYIFLDSQHIFYLDCTTTPYTFKNMEPVFDTIAQEFRTGQPNT